MTFPVSAVPNAGDIPSQSQSQIQTNFTNQIGWAAVDHAGYGTVNAGTHEQVTFSNVTTQVAPSNPASILYTKNDAATNPQLFFLNGQNSTFYVPSANGSTVLMGGIILQWGNVSVNSGSSATVTFPIAFPSACFNVQVTARTAGVTYASCQVPSTTQVAVTLPAGSGNQVVYWMAIGN